MTTPGIKTDVRTFYRKVELSAILVGAGVKVPVPTRLAEVAS
jgi:hypothetical protein